MLSAEIISIGNELLTGSTINTNAAFISRQLHAIGFEVERHTSIADDKEIIIETLAECLASCPLVIATGGLGPTLDDLTREAVSELIGSPLEFHNELAKALLQRFGAMDSLKNQATIPKKALILPNPLGTASGLIFMHGNSLLVVLPGVPLEMEVLMLNEVIPYLKKLFPFSSQAREELHFFHLFESSVDPTLRHLNEKLPGLKIGIYPHNSLLSIIIEGTQREVSIAKEELLKQFDQHYYESSDGTVEMAVQELFIKNGWTLSLAESCTGGAIAARLTAVPGSSAYFLGSLVAYSNFVKTKVLNISSALLQEKGAVSKEVALAMANCMQTYTSSTVAIGVTGFAGPDGGTKENPIGTVYFAINNEAYLLSAKGNRSSIIERSVNHILGALLSFAKNPKSLLKGERNGCTFNEIL